MSLGRASTTLLAVTVGAAVTLATSASAQPQNGAAGDALSSVDAQRQARAMDRDADLERAQDARREIERLKRQLLSLGQAEASSERTVTGARDQLRRLNLQEAELKVRIDHNQESLTKLLAALQSYARNPPPALLVDPRSARDAVRATLLIKAITPDLEARARAFAQQSESLKTVRRNAAAASGALFTAESDVADRRARIEELIVQKRALQTQLASDATAADNDVKRLALRARSLGELVDVLADRSVGNGGGSGDLDLPQSFTAPVPGPPERRFGDAASDPAHAKGWTWATEPKTIVLCPATAKVDYAGPLKGWGSVVILRLGAHHLVLAGLADIDVATDERVEAGSPIGRMGDGPAPPELYLELRNGTTPIDPKRWLEPLSVATRPGETVPALRGRN